ncbi:hypothetical protein A2U01_0106684, partial [Trifolium medium]|nr:hypothetical protein [Trifolium medium]
IAYASPVRRSEDSSEYEDDQLVGTEVASVAQDVRGKQSIVSDAAPKKKKAVKEKLEVVVKEKEKRKRTAVS